MFKISEFSQLSQVSIKTLRYYDQLGLLKPAHSDPCTGYRYYTADQLLRLNRILAFKDLGFTLEQINRLLDEHIPPEQIRGMFRLKQAEIQALIEEEQARLSRIEGRLRQIEESEGRMPPHDVVLKRVEPQLVASIRTSTAPSAVPLLFEELDRHLQQQGVKAVATLPHVVLWHGCEECEDATDLEVACPVSPGVVGNGDVMVRTLPEAARTASILHQCQPQSICCASVDLASWIEENGYQVLPGQPRREVYLSREEGLFYIAEVQIPVGQISVCAQLQK
jgi:DNA-binding transcriptional MerR regulator